MAQLDLDRIREMLEKALEENDFEKLSRLAPTADALLVSLQQDLQRDPVYSRVMRNRQGASEEDIAYANAMTNQLGKARQISSLAQQGLVALGATAGAGVAGKAVTAQAAKPLQAATTAAAKGLDIQANFAEGQADIAKRRAATATTDAASTKKAAQEAADVVGQRRATTRQTQKAAGKGAQKNVASVRAQQLAAEQEAKAARKAAGRAANVSGIAGKEATQTATEAASRRALAKSFLPAAARSAPRFFGAAPLALAELALTPLVEFYNTDRQLATFLGQLETMANQSPDGKLSIEAMTNEQANALNASPDLAKLLWDQGALDRSVYAYIFGPEAAIEEGLYDEPEIQRGREGGESEPFRAPDPLKDPAWQQTAGEMEKIGGSVARIGANEAGMAEVPTPQRRKMAAEHAVARSRLSPRALAAIQDIGEREADLQTFDPTEYAAELGEKGRGTMDVAISTPDGDEVQARIAESRSKKTGNIFKKLIDAFSGAGETPSGQAADAAMPQDIG